MNEKLQAVRDEQKQVWNKVSASWKKWNDFTMHFLKPMGEAIIKALDIESNNVILDIASGTGEPAFSMAAIAKNGEVYATDLSEEMLTIAQAYANQSGIRNIQFKIADVSKLPFKNNFFDKVSCRMGFMFFPDMQLAANEMFRVCKSKGKVAISVWDASEKNDWYTTIIKVLSNHIKIPEQAAGAPGMFRCAKPGLVKQLFMQAGFKNIKEEIIQGKVDFGTIENYWLNRTEMSEPIVHLLSNTDEAMRAIIKNDLLASCNNQLINGKFIMNYSSLVISAEK